MYSFRLAFCACIWYAHQTSVLPRVEISLGSTTRAAPKSTSAVILCTLLQNSRVIDVGPSQGTGNWCLVSFPYPPPTSQNQICSGCCRPFLSFSMILRTFCISWTLTRGTSSLINLSPWTMGFSTSGNGFVQQESKHLSDLSRFVMEGRTEHVYVMAPKTVNKHIETLVRLMSPSCLHHILCVSRLYVNPGESRHAIGCWRFSMLECIPIHSWNSYVSWLQVLYSQTRQFTSRHRAHVHLWYFGTGATCRPI